MPIQVICPGCHTRFSVGDEHGGKTGPCPKCEIPIRIPDKSEEVVVHAPELGPKDSEGRLVLKPIERSETKITAVGIVGIIGAVLVTLVVAFLIGRMYRTGDDVQVPTWVLGAGAFLLAPPLAVAGYSFLRDDELEPYRGASLALRVLICACVYALLWGAYLYVKSMLFGSGSPEIWHLAFLVPPLVAAGAVAPFAALDLDYTSACVHCGMYLIVTVLMRLLMGLSPV